MYKLPMCRICLIKDVRMHCLVNTQLQEIYELLSGNLLETKDTRPLHACYMCCARLRNCLRLRTACLHSEELFSHLLENDSCEVTPSQDMNVQQTDSVMNMNVEPDIHGELKMDPLLTTDEQLHEEHVGDVQDNNNIIEQGICTLVIKQEDIKSEYGTFEDEELDYSIQSTRSLGNGTLENYVSESYRSISSVDLQDIMSNTVDNEMPSINCNDDRQSTASPTRDLSSDDDEPNYEPRMHRRVKESSDIDTSDYQEPNIVSSPVMKRHKCDINSKKIKAQRLRNAGAEYISLSKNRQVVPARQMKSPCSTKCRLQCFVKIKEEERQKLFDDYWGMASLTRQRDFIASSMEVVHPRYQYKKLNSSRKSKHAFHFIVNENKIRVCKIFFRNTLDISDRPIRTVIEKMSDTGIVEVERRGKHKRKRFLIM